MKRVLVIGQGAREHALCFFLQKSAKVYCSPGSAGIERIATCVALSTNEDVVHFCQEQSIDLVVVGPEVNLAQGLADALGDVNIACFGPMRAPSQLETSKGFARDICRDVGVPIPRYCRVRTLKDAEDFVDESPFMCVIKKDALASGKGVFVPSSHQEVRDILSKLRVEGGEHQELVLEEKLDGEELSIFILCDGQTCLPLGAARDYKRAFEGGCGPNTGGMGSYSSPALMDDDALERVVREFAQPVLDALEARHMPFSGLLYVSLIMTSQGPFLIEYNVRFGDPETQAILTRLRVDLFELLHACASKNLALFQDRKLLDDNAALCVVLAREGYPGTPTSNHPAPITGLHEAGARSGCFVFHAHTKCEADDSFEACSGRVLSVVGTSATFEDARERAYDAVQDITFDGLMYRKDIGM